MSKPWIDYNELRAKGFTNREAEIILLYNSEQNEFQISRQLFITEKTVDFHMGNILKKIGAKDKRFILFDCGVKE